MASASFLCSGNYGNSLPTRGLSFSTVTAARIRAFLKGDAAWLRNRRVDLKSLLVTSHTPSSSRGAKRFPSDGPVLQQPLFHLNCKTCSPDRLQSLWRGLTSHCDDTSKFETEMKSSQRLGYDNMSSTSLTLRLFILLHCS